MADNTPPDDLSTRREQFRQDFVRTPDRNDEAQSQIAELERLYDGLARHTETLRQLLDEHDRYANTDLAYLNSSLCTRTRAALQPVPGAPGRQIYVVTGRIPGDDDDQMMAFAADSERHAKLAFEVAMYEQSDETRQQVIDQSGESIYYSQVLAVRSDTVHHPAPAHQLLAVLEDTTEALEADHGPTP